MASIQPGPTSDQGTASISASAPCATACCTVVGVGAAGLLDVSSTAVVVVDEHAASIMAASATRPEILFTIDSFPGRGKRVVDALTNSWCFLGAARRSRGAQGSAL
jgi:hypothetical protein